MFAIQDVVRRRIRLTCFSLSYNLIPALCMKAIRKFPLWNFLALYIFFIQNLVVHSAFYKKFWFRRPFLIVILQQYMWNMKEENKSMNLFNNFSIHSDALQYLNSPVHLSNGHTSVYIQIACKILWSSSYTRSILYFTLKTIGEVCIKIECNDPSISPLQQYLLFIILLI